jgi:hypothetical protein
MEFQWERRTGDELHVEWRDPLTGNPSFVATT